MTVAGILTSSIGPGGTRFSVPAALSAPGPRDPVSENGAVAVGRDRSAAAAGTRSAARIAGLESGAETARAGGALVAAADDAFADIRTRLEEMRRLAAQAAEVKLKSTDPMPAETSRVERAILQESFARLRSEIDGIAAGTTHDGLAILAGGVGGGSLDLAFAVGGDGDSVVVSIEPGSVADLDAELAGADLFTVAAATTALADVNAALTSVDGARAALAAGAVRLRGAADGATVRAASEAATLRDRLATRVSIDVTHKLAGEVSDERGIDPIAHATETARTLLDITKFSEPPAAFATATTDWATGTAGPSDAADGKGSGGGAGAQTPAAAAPYDAGGGKPRAAGQGETRGTRVDVAA